MSTIKKLGILVHSLLRPISTGLCQKIKKRAHPNGPPITVYMTPWSFCHELATCLHLSLSLNVVKQGTINPDLPWYLGNWETGGKPGFAVYRSFVNKRLKCGKENDLISMFAVIGML